MATSKPISDKEIPKETLKHGDVVWACGFDIDVDRHDNSITHSYSKPVDGMIQSMYKDTNTHANTQWYVCRFVPFAKNGRLRKSGAVSLYARRFAQTYNDCVEIYNQLIDEKIAKLLNTIADLEILKIKRIENN